MRDWQQTETIIVSQTAAGSNANSVNVSVPVWEIIIIAGIMAAIIFVVCSCLVKKINNFCGQEMKRQARLAQLEEAV
jgi:hypothetical protein